MRSSEGGTSGLDRRRSFPRAPAAVPSTEPPFPPLGRFDALVWLASLRRRFPWRGVWVALVTLVISGRIAGGLYERPASGDSFRSGAESCADTGRRRDARSGESDPGAAALSERSSDSRSRWPRSAHRYIHRTGDDSDFPERSRPGGRHHGGDTGEHGRRRPSAPGGAAGYDLAGHPGYARGTAAASIVVSHCGLRPGGRGWQR